MDNKMNENNIIIKKALDNIKRDKHCKSICCVEPVEQNSDNSIDSIPAVNNSTQEVSTSGKKLLEAEINITDTALS